MLSGLFNGMEEMVHVFYYMGSFVWNFMLALIGTTVAETPASFSSYTWAYVSNELWGFSAAIGATLLNISFYVGFIRQASNLKQNVTLEILVESGIKVVFGNYLLLNGLKLMKLFFGISGIISGTLILETPMAFAQTDRDIGSFLFYFFFGGIYFGVCLVCSGMIFLTVYGRFLNLYLLTVTAPIAFGLLPGGPGMSQSTYAWIRTFFAKTFEVVLVAMALVIASKMCAAIDFGRLSGTISGAFDGIFQALQNMATMVLLAASVKGMDLFMRRAFGL